MSVLASVVAEAGTDAWLRDGLAWALEANERWEQLAAEFWEENARLRKRHVRPEAELERVNAELAVLRRLVFGRCRSGEARAHSFKLCREVRDDALA